MHASASIANLFIDKAVKNNVPLTAQKIQKLLYIAHGYYLCAYKKPLLNEVFSAWKFGPVLPSVYHQCKYFSGRKGIRKPIHDSDPISGELSIAPRIYDRLAHSVVSFTWEHYSHLEGDDFFKWTNSKDTPWDIITQSGSEILRGQSIPNDLIMDFFDKNQDKRLEESDIPNID